MCFESLLDDIDIQKRESNAKLFHALIKYIDSFLNQFHHPKEDDYLFPVLLRRSSSANKLIKELQDDHHKGASFCHKLGDTLIQYETNRVGFGEFHEAAKSYILYERRHIGREEAELLPMAHEYLKESDWEPIDIVFSANDDPMFGEKPKQHYRQLCRLITNTCIFGDPLL